MSEKPILFNTEMARAILEGRKTVTRRVIKPHYKDGEAGFRINRRVADGVITGIEYYDEEECGTGRYIQPPYQTGDILYVRETWAKDYFGNYVYMADYVGTTISPEWKWKPSIHMRKETARIWLRVTDVRVERLNDITKEQAGREGVTWETDNSGLMRISQFIKLWNSTLKKSDYDKYCWNANPWVWVIEFERYEKAEANNEVGNTTRNV